MAKQLPPGWRVDKAERVFESPFVNVRQEALVDPTGRSHDWFIAEHHDIVAVFCVTADNRIVVNRQFKFGIKDWVIEPPAGFVDPGETPAAAAVRELKEETGYVADKVELLLTLAASPTSQDNRAHLFYTEGAKDGGELALEDCEVIEHLLLAPEELRRMLERGAVNTVLSVAAFREGLERLDRGRKNL
jgi:ADP-ribose pyrophosphatase